MYRRRTWRRRGYVTGGSNRRRWSTAWSSTPTTGMKRQVAANPDTADVPAALRTADYGRGMRWQVCWRADGRQHRESLPTREAAEARAAELNDDIRSGRYVDPRGGNRTLDERVPPSGSPTTPACARPRSTTTSGTTTAWSARASAPPASATSTSGPSRHGSPTSTPARYAPSTANRTRRAPSRPACAACSAACSATPCAAGGSWLTRLRACACPARPCNASTRSPRPRRAPSPTRPESSAPRPGRPRGRPIDPRLIVLLLASTGMRPGQMAALDVRDVDLAARHDQRRQDHDQGRGRPLPVRAGRHQDPRGPPAPADTAVPARRAGGAGRRPRRRRTPVHLPGAANASSTPSGPSAWLRPAMAAAGLDPTGAP